MRSSYAISIALTLAVPLSGCVLGAGTGDVTNGTVAGTDFNLFGYSNVSGTPVNAYVLSNPNSLSSGWTPFGSTTTSTTNQGTSSSPQYSYGLTTNPVTATQWPQGGLVRFEVQSIWGTYSAPTNMVTFTNEGQACINAGEGPGVNPYALGEQCASPYGTVIVMPSSSPLPSAVNTSTSYLSFPYGSPGAAPSAGAATTATYYAAINAPQTLATNPSSNFRTTYGYSVTGNGLVNAKYYNAGDLGIGRDMSCWAWGPNMNGRACYVTNYGTTGTPPTPQFGLDPQTVINQVISQSNPVATVAMVYNPTLTSNVVQFMVYDGNGNLSEFAALDNEGLVANANRSAPSHANINVPNNCLTCHGQSSNFNTATGVISNAFFLPFDPAANPYAPTANIVFSTSNSAYNQAAMMPVIAQLNAHVYATNPSPAIQSFINGAYGTTSGPNASSTFNDAYVPPAWQTPTGTLLGPGNQAGANPAASTQVYNEVIKPFCRTCHMSNTNGLDWTQEAQFDGGGEPAVAWSFMCNGNTTPMPHSLQAQNRFWDSPARAHVAAAFNLSGGCTP